MSSGKWRLLYPGLNVLRVLFHFVVLKCIPRSREWGILLSVLMRQINTGRVIDVRRKPTDPNHVFIGALCSLLIWTSLMGQFSPTKCLLSGHTEAGEIYVDINW